MKKVQEGDLDWFDDPVKAVPLGLGENTCLQVLTGDFSLTRQGLGGNKGVHLHIELSTDMPTIRRREQRHAVKQQLAEANGADFKELARDEQRVVEAVVLTGEAEHYAPPVEDRCFMYRYASGGTLPIAKIGTQHFFCLFYRDVEPWGWNIANGSCDSISELRNPVEAGRREFREELIVLRRGAEGADFVFEWEGDARKSRLEHPDFLEARRLWDEHSADHGIENLTPTPLPVRPIPGPDSLHVVIDGVERIHHGIFVNINADDFGIEIDKIGVFEIDHDHELLDGEIVDGLLLNRPIGLFDIGRADEMLKAEVQVPDWIFFRGICHSGSAFERITTEEFRRHLEKRPAIRTPETIEKWLGQPAAARHGLCPVTRQIVERFRTTDVGRELISRSGSGVSCFISYATADLKFAESLHSKLVENGVSCWFAPEDLRIGDAVMSEVNDAIRLHDRVIVVLSETSIASDWVEHEVNCALEEEVARDRKVLFPIRIDEAVMACSFGWAKRIREAHKPTGRHIGDFTSWRDDEDYQEAIGRLLLDIGVGRGA